MNKKRLLKLADYLDTVPRKNFNIDIWRCGSVGCAMGHACDIPAFKRVGLKLMTRYDMLCPALGRLIAFDAAAKLFSITHYQATCLFSPIGYGRQRGPGVVAKRIRRFVANGGKR